MNYEMLIFRFRFKTICQILEGWLSRTRFSLYAFLFIRLSFRLFDVLFIVDHNALPFCTWSHPSFLYWTKSFDSFIVPSLWTSLRITVSNLSDTTGSPVTFGTLWCCPSQIILLQICSSNDIPCMDLSIILCIVTSRYSIFVVAYISITYN